MRTSLSSCFCSSDVVASCITFCRGRRVSFSTRRRHSMSAVAAQLPCPPLFLPSGVILPPRLPGGAGVHSSDGDSARRSKNILRDRGHHGTLAPQMEPEDTYSRFRSAIPGILLSMSGALRVTHFRWRTFPVPQRVTTNLFINKINHHTLESRKILKELLSCSSCFDQSAFRSASLNKSSTAALFPRGPVKLVVVLNCYTAENTSLCIRVYPIMKIHW